MFKPVSCTLEYMNDWSIKLKRIVTIPSSVSRANESSSSSSPQPPDRQADITSDFVLHIGDKPITIYALDVVSALAKNERIILRSTGKYIPNAVAAANIVTDELLKKGARVQKILLDTEEEPGIGSMTSTIELFMDKAFSTY